MSALSAFEDVAEYYPGSKRPIVRHPNRKEPEAPDPDRWDYKPRLHFIAGEEREFFTSGHLALAMCRKPGTMRKWEREGVIPKATFNWPSDDPRGRRRLYTREQVEGIVKIAQEEGILRAHAKPIKDTKFTERVVALFRSLQ